MNPAKNVLMELLTGDGQRHIASAVGFPLCMDMAIEQCHRIDFARVCVEVAREDGLPTTIEVDTEEAGKVEVIVEYPWKPEMCSICKVFDMVIKVVQNLVKCGNQRLVFCLSVSSGS